MRTLRHWWLLAGVGVGFALASGTSAQERTNPFAASMAGFQQRVEDYIVLRDKVAGTMPKIKETDDPTKINARERALGAAIARERRAARAGEIFGDLSPYLQRILAADWKTRSVADRNALLEEIPPGLKLMVNQPYPATIPLVTVPAKLLLELPTLPEAVEYRFVDKRLLLRDRDANLIVDVLVGIPAARSR